MCYLQCVESVRLRVPYVRTHGLPCIEGGVTALLCKRLRDPGSLFSSTRARRLDTSLIIPGGRPVARHISACGRPPPRVPRPRVIQTLVQTRVARVWAVWDFARPRRNYIRRAPEPCVGMRHPLLLYPAIFLHLHPVIKRIRTNVPGNIWRPSPSKGKVIMGRFCSYERQQQKRRSQSSYL